MKKNTKIHILSAAVLATLALAVGCGVRTPGTETPIPNDRGVEKSFFVETKQANVEGATKTVLKPKTFLCGWAPISESGAYGSQALTHAVHMAGHCNMEFEITEGNLIGRLVNPTFPNDRSRWNQALVIPIRKHYYYERAKDTYGRETNEFIENANRSDYSARPMMDLDLEGLTIRDWDLSMFGNARTGAITNVSDVEWDKKTGFLGFTATLQNPEWGSAVGARIRFNFKAFEHNPNFQKTPYSPLNAKRLNALHVIGEKVDGLYQVWSAAKWDLTKTHDVYLHGFPEQYVPMAELVIDQWNEAFAKIGKPKAFRLNRQKMKYPFDLRYPMMVWVDDPQISAYSPLGVGMAQADVRNGEIQWGQITLYGGMLERYIKMHLEPIAAGTGSTNGKAIGTRSPQGPSFFSTYFNPTKALELPPFLNSGTRGTPNALLDATGRLGSQNSMLSKMLATAAASSPLKAGKPLDQAAMEQVRQQSLEISREMTRSLGETLNTIQMRASKENLHSDMSRLYGFTGSPTGEMRKAMFGDNESRMSELEKLKALTANFDRKLRAIPQGVVHDTDRRFVDVAPSMIAALSQSRVGYEEGLRKVIRELIMHEYGHFLGLGHQFKENIIPEEGTVPKKYIFELQADAKKGFLNSTSVMGYKHPVTEINEVESKIVPGPQDLLVLRYLYNQEYATYRAADDVNCRAEQLQACGDFKFAKVPASGVIPANNPEKPEHVTAYFPQCNDFDATFSTDPYCNRFDRGNTAQTIVKSYFEDLNTNLVSKIYSFTDSRGTNTEEAEAALWGRSLTTLGRIRIFYDHMRQKYASEIRSISNSERDLYEFSRVCTGEIEGSANLRSLFTANPGLKELCQVNRMAVKEMTNLMILPGPDRSRMDWDNASIGASMTGGDSSPDWSRVFGTHSALSVLPLKLSAVNALTTPFPYTMLGGWMFPVPRYIGEDGRFSYSTLYPIEFTEAFANAVEKNLSFGSSIAEKPTMGLPVTSMGYFLDSQIMSNEANRIGGDLIKNIRNQTEFRFSMKAIILKFMFRDDKTRATHFEALLYDPASDQKQVIPQAFLLPGGKLIVRANVRNFVFPVSKLMFVQSDESGTVAFAWAYHVEYDDRHDDILAAHSVKATLEKLNNEALDQCIRGNNDGLASFFTAQKEPAVYPGFYVMSGIAGAGAKDKQIRFLDSVKENFEMYKKATGVSADRCEKTLQSVGLVVTSAAMLNGYWLPEVFDYLSTK